MATRRTNNGKQIDMDALMAASSANSPAVGNMGVNANGDVVQGGRVVKKNEERVRDYYKQNPKSSTATASLKGETPSKLKPDTDAPAAATQPKTAATAKAEKSAPKPKVKKEVAPAVDEFDSDLPEPLGFKEVELPNGDIQMVPYYREEDA